MLENNIIKSMLIALLMCQIFMKTCSLMMDIDSTTSLEGKSDKNGGGTGTRNRECYVPYWAA